MLVLGSSFIAERRSEGSFAYQQVNTLPAPRLRL